MEYCGMTTTSVQAEKFNSNRFEQFQQENTIMAFVNEAIPEQDTQKVNALVNYQTISAIDYQVHPFSLISNFWTIDRKRNVYLIDLGGGGRHLDDGRLPYAALVIDGQVVLFNVVLKGEGNSTIGLNWQKEIYNLHIPQALESRREEIKQLIREALEENVCFDPFADGGTIAKPNTVARKNILSFNVEFK
jgi:hypothetical protein